MAANSVLVNANDYQHYYSEFQILNGNETVTLSEVEIEYISENSSSLSYTDLSYSLGMETLSPSTASVSSTSSYNPEMIIVEEPKNQLRFRYKSEKGCHGGLKPVIKLLNCDSPDGIWIKATLYTCDKPPTLHVFELDGKQCKNGACWQKLSNDCIAKFPSLSICMKKKDEIAVVLKERIKQKCKELKKRINEQEIEKEVQEKMKTFNLNSGMLCFEAFYHKDEKLCEQKLFSNPIYNQKCTLAGELKITRLSSFAGKASGNEDMILLCEKIRKDDIEIIFSCQNQNIKWEERAQFNPADVHHQVAIPFKTPRFIDNIEQEVSIRLHRKSDGKSGEPRIFVYKQCEDFECKPLKRKRPNPPEDIFMSLSAMPCTPSTSSTPSDHSSEYFDSNSVFLREILESFNNPINVAGVDESDWTLQSEHLDNPVTMDAILNLASLNISGNVSAQKKNVDPKRKIEHTSSCEVDRIQMLRTGVINLLKERGNNTFLKFLPALLSMKDENGNSLLHLVVIEKSDNLPLLIKMVEAAPDGLINQTNKLQMTPLHIAVSKGYWKVVRILLMSGADPNIKDKNGNMCTHLAAMYNLPWCLGEILAPLLGDKKRKYLPSVDDLNYEGLAPFHLSVKNDSKVCVKLLIQAKANLNISDGKCGKTPLHFAYEKSSELVSLLLSQPGVNSNAEDFNGNTPNSCMYKLHKNSTFVPKPTECCIELSTESSNSNEDDSKEVKKSNIFDTNIVKEVHIDENSEDLFCKTLDSNGLWKKLGLYIMDEKELDVIELMDTTPTKTILNELKKQHAEKYPERLKFILSDGELKEFAQLLKI